MFVVPSGKSKAFQQGGQHQMTSWTCSTTSTVLKPCQWTLTKRGFLKTNGLRPRWFRCSQVKLSKAHLWMFHFILKINGILLKKLIFKTIKLQNQVFLNNMGNPNGGLETLCGGNPGLETLTTPVIKVHLLFNSSLKS